MHPAPRPAVLADRQAVEEIVRHACSPYICRIGRPPGPMLDDYEVLISKGRVYVVELDGTIQGILVLVPEQDAMGATATLSRSRSAYSSRLRPLPVPFFEFTQCREHPVAASPTHEDLLVFYIPDRKEWESACERLANNGFVRVMSYNPYWDVLGQTFADPDGYRVVVQNASWPS
jgi:hypothetical protein